MAQQGELRIPVALRPTAAPVITLTDRNGLPHDAGELPVEIQVEAYRQGVIPYVPALGRDGTAAAEAALRS